VPKTILWAVDALEFDRQIIQSAIDVLRPLAERLGAEVQPVHMLMPSHLSSATDLSEIAETSPAHNMRPAAEHFLSEALKKIPIPVLREALVIPVESTSLQNAVEALNRYADSVNAECIVVSSHGRRGLGRFFLGSFAETLMSHAHRPVVVVHPGTQVSGLKKMLFPSDLTDEGHRHFLEAIEIARRLDLELHLLHCVSYSVEPILQSGVYLLSGGWMPLEAPLGEQIEKVKEVVDHWVTEARRTGIRATGSIYSLGGGIADTVLRIAEQDQADFLAISVQTGPIASMILGSISRDVVRRSRCPVIVLKSLALKHHRKKKAAA